MPPEVMPLGIITKICTDDPKNADRSTMNRLLKNVPALPALPFCSERSVPLVFLILSFFLFISIVLVRPDCLFL